MNHAPARKYDQEFYSRHRELSERSAQLILPFIFEICMPRRVLDVGCGHGYWLQVAKQLGVQELVGVDGEWVDPAELVQKGIQFHCQDLVNPVDLGERFDLVMSLEVAEHLPEERATSFVKDLCRHADLVYFGAAIPRQGGTHHVNEQYADFWVERFENEGFEAIDIVRPRVWAHREIGLAYRQNSILFAKQPDALREALVGVPRIPRGCSALVHPELMETLSLCEPKSVDILRHNLLLPKRLLRRLSGVRHA